MEYETHPIGTDNLLNFNVKDVYGTARFYPQDRQSRCIVNELMQQKCLNATQVKKLKVVGGFAINILRDWELD
jgi:hypothetical protein